MGDTPSFTAYTYMNYYVAVTPDGEAESSVYAFSDDGLTLTLTDMSGEWELAYQKVTDSENESEQTGEVIEIATAEELAAINENLFLIKLGIDLITCR